MEEKCPDWAKIKFEQKLFPEEVLMSPRFSQGLSVYEKATYMLLVCSVLYRG